MRLGFHVGHEDRCEIARCSQILSFFHVNAHGCSQKLMCNEKQICACANEIGNCLRFSSGVKNSVVNRHSCIENIT